MDKTVKTAKINIVYTFTKLGDSSVDEYGVNYDLWRQESTRVV